MKFEKADLFCPKCGKYSVYKNQGESYGCNICLNTFSMYVWELAKWQLTKEEQEMTVDQFGKIWLEGGYKKIVFKK